MTFFLRIQTNKDIPIIPYDTHSIKDRINKRISVSDWEVSTVSASVDFYEGWVKVSQCRGSITCSKAQI